MNDAEQSGWGSKALGQSSATTGVLSVASNAWITRDSSACEHDPVPKTYAGGLVCSPGAFVSNDATVLYLPDRFLPVLHAVRLHRRLHLCCMPNRECNNRCVSDTAVSPPFLVFKPAHHVIRTPASLCAIPTPLKPNHVPPHLLPSYHHHITL